MNSEKKKKILIIGPAYPYRGGNSLFVSYVYETLDPHFEVKIFNYKLLYPSFLFPGTTQYDKSEKTIINAPNVRIVNSINPFNWISTANKIKEENPDLVVFDWWHPFFGPCHFGISFLLKSKFKNKFLFITENFVSHEGNFIDIFLTKLGLKYASSFLTLSVKVAEELKELSGARKIYRSELPIYECYSDKNNKSIEEFKKDLGFSSDNFVLLFFGYIRKYKGLDILIKAFPNIKKNNSDAKLLIVGEFYDNPEEYKTLIKSLNIENDVVLINNFVPNEEVEKYYNASDVVMLPYRSATQSGILNVAYGFYKPVIVTNVGGLSEFVIEGKTGLIVAPESEKALSDGVYKFRKLQKEVNFTEEIKTKVLDNSFTKLPELFEEILRNSN